MNQKKVIWCLTLGFLAIVVSWRFLDARLALLAVELLGSSSFLQSSTADLPDFLFPLACLVSCLLWGNYFRLRYQGRITGQAQFSLLAASAVPLAYLLKWLLKYVFGRINTRLWLAAPADNGFHWFRGGGDYSGFPSGHMAVFAAFFTALWLFYPRFRTASIGLLLLLAIALVATGYHFLSDVIAGTFLGIFTTLLTRACCGAKPGR